MGKKLSEWVALETPTRPAQRGVHYWCAGCRTIHGITIEGPGAWSFNGDWERPTFSPSQLSHGVVYEIGDDGEGDLRLPKRDAAGNLIKGTCHTFITDGMVQFLGDCTHELAGQTVPLPDLPASFLDD